MLGSGCQWLDTPPMRPHQRAAFRKCVEIPARRHCGDSETLHHFFDGYSSVLTEETENFTPAFFRQQPVGRSFRHAANVFHAFSRGCLQAARGAILHYLSALSNYFLRLVSFSFLFEPECCAHVIGCDSARLSLADSSTLSIQFRAKPSSQNLCLPRARNPRCPPCSVISNVKAGFDLNAG